MSALSKEYVEHVADVARLELSAEEKESFTKDMTSIVEFVHQVTALDRELNEKEVQPTSHILSLSNVVREDKVEESLSIEEVFKNTADHHHGQFKVPSILEG